MNVISLILFGMKDLRNLLKYKRLLLILKDHLVDQSCNFACNNNFQEKIILSCNIAK